MFTHLTTPTIIAHRGASAHAPENSLAAFELAHQQGADAIELDVKLSMDGIPVVIHDPTVDRTTKGSGTVAELELASLQKLDAGDGQHIPTLAEVFAAVGRDLYINIELTNYTTSKDDLVDKVVDVIKAYDMQERVFFSSFLAKNLKHAAELLPDTARGLLALPTALGFFARSFGFPSSVYQAIHPGIQNVTEKMITQAHQRGQRVHVWTVNKPNDMRRLAKLGVDGIFTDDPKLAVEILRSAS